MKRANLPNLILRLGIAFVFIFPAVSGFINPTSWIGYFPQFMRGIVPDAMLLGGFGIVEIIIALWILSGKKIFWPAIIAALMLFSIVLFNFRNMEVLFRDVALAAATLSLALGARQETKKQI